MSKGEAVSDATIAALRDIGAKCRGEVLIPSDNFHYAWIVAALARGVVENRTDDRYTAELANMTLREIAILANADPSFYDT